MAQIIKGTSLQIGDENGEYHDIADLKDSEIDLSPMDFEITGRIEMDRSSRIQLRVWIMFEQAKEIVRRIVG